MGLLSGKKSRYFGISSSGELIPRRSKSGIAPPYVSPDQALQQSAVWASLRLRADLVSTLPCDVYRKVQGIAIEVTPKPPVLVNTGGDIGYMEWMYVSQVELDRSGNFIGVIRELDGNGKPALIEPHASSECSIKTNGGKIIEYRIGQEKYQPGQIWHERQYSIAGSPLGLSPIAYAAYTLGEYKSIQDFIIGWFNGSAEPRAMLRNTERPITEDEALLQKESWMASKAVDEPFVTGSDWEFSMVAAERASADWIKGMELNVVDIARFLGVPSDLIDSAVSGQSVTYANITQRNLQFLIMNLGPAIARREYGLSNLLAKPRYVKLNADALLRMDATARAELLAKKIASRQLAPSEARAYEDNPPFTEAQMAEFDRFWPPKAAPAASAV
jgi:HK97 family phage portal protein